MNILDDRDLKESVNNIRKTVVRTRFNKLIFVVMTMKRDNESEFVEINKFTKINVTK